MVTKIFLLLALSFFTCFNQLNAIEIKPDATGQKYMMIRRPKATLTGPYFGYQKGLMDVFEIGMERQWKRLKLVKPTIHAGHFGINYNWKNNVMGYDLGYWHKKGRLNFTYGANLSLRTNFSKSRFGITPTLGYKVWQLHLQTGYHILSNKDYFETNTFFISVRFVVINDIDLKLTRRKKKKKAGLFD